MKAPKKLYVNEKVSDNIYLMSTYDMEKGEYSLAEAGEGKARMMVCPALAEISWKGSQPHEYHKECCEVEPKCIPVEQIGVDKGKAGGDMTAKVTWHTENGNFFIDKIETEKCIPVESVGKEDGGGIKELKWKPTSIDDNMENLKDSHNELVREVNKLMDAILKINLTKEN